MTVRVAGYSGTGQAGRGRAATRESLVDTALRLFTERGYVGVRVEDIAREAGMSRATFYKYFAEREEILAELFARLLGGELDVDLEGPTTTEDRVKTVVTAAVRQMIEQPELARFVYSLPVRHSALLRPQDAATPAVFGRIHALLEAGIAQGEVRSDQPVDLLCAHVHNALEAGMRDWAEGRVDEPMPRVAQLLDLAFHGVAPRQSRA